MLSKNRKAFIIGSRHDISAKVKFDASFKAFA